LKRSPTPNPDQANLPGIVPGSGPSGPSPIRSKVAYVKSQPQTRDHGCHWPGCNKQVPPAMWGCRPHWYRIPAALRHRIWVAYRTGQESDLRPSETYLEAAEAVQQWIRLHGGPV